MARFLPAAAPAERPGLARALAVRLGLVRLAWAGLLAVAAAVASAIDPEAVPPATVALSSVALLCSVVATVLLQAALGLGRVGPWVARYPLENLVIVIAALALEPSLGPTGAVAALPIATVASLLLGLLAAGGELGRARTSASPPAPMLRFARLQAAVGALTQLGLRGAIPVTALLGTAAETADAALAIGVGTAGLFGFVQLFVALLPGAVRTASREGAAGPERQLGRLAARCTLVAVPLAAVLAATAEPIVAAVFGPAYSGAADALRIAFAIIAVAPLFSWLSQLAILRLRPGIQVGAAVGGAAAFCLLVIPAVTAAGAAGAAAVMLASVSVSVAVLLLGLSAGRRPVPA